MRGDHHKPRPDENRPGSINGSGAEYAEKELDRYRDMVENLPALICRFQADGTLTYVNRAYREFFGNGEPLVGRNLLDFIPEAQHGQVKAHFTALTPQSPTVIYERQAIGSNGIAAWQEWTDRAVFDSAGQVIEYQSLGRNITDRKQVEEALRKSEEDYRLVVENAHDAIFIAQNGRIPFANRKAWQMGMSLGFDSQHSAYVDFILPEDRDMVAARHQRRLRGEKMPTLYSFRLQGRNGHQIWVELNSVLIDWKGAPATLNFLRDITEQKRLEAQFHQAQKMEAVGNLAGGIAHDFNNLLMCINGNTAVLLHEIGSSHPHHELLADIRKSVENGTRLTRQLLGFARRGKYEHRPININALLHKTGAMFARTRREITVHCRLAEHIWTVEVDEGQIDQVLLNLYVNSWQAMPRGGRIDLTTRNLVIDHDDPQRPDIAPGKYVRVTVADEGDGIDAEHLTKVFDPFFTTKEPGQGTGLGLAAAYGIVRNHGGIIEVSSEKNVGTAFHIYLPASDKPLPRAFDTDEAPSDLDDLPKTGSAKRTITVLAADDDAGILDIIGRMLRREDFRLLTAASGKEAVAVYRTAAEPIDIVLLDMIMPEMGGFEAFNRIREIDPHSRFILSSGYSISEEVVALLASGGVGFLQKPYEKAQLIKKVKGILNTQ